jgi:hypothetical protein
MLHNSGDLKQVIPGVKQDELLDEGLSSALRLRLNGAWETYGAPRMTFSNSDIGDILVKYSDLTSTMLRGSTLRWWILKDPKPPRKRACCMMLDVEDLEHHMFFLLL